MYDCEFRIHMSKNPLRNWGIILQQAYTMILKDRTSGSSARPEGQSTGGSSSKSKKVCYAFNRGRCKFGNRCRFEHKCGTCAKFGHGNHNCRKLIGGEFKEKETGEEMGKAPM